MLDINWNPSRRELRQFGLIWLPLFVTVVGIVVFRRTGGWPVAMTALASVAGVCAVIALVSPMGLKPLVVGWMAASYPIGWTISHVVLGITYFGLFTILGAAMRIFGYDPLDRRRPSTAQTFWRARDAQRPAASYFRQF